MRIHVTQNYNNSEKEHEKNEKGIRGFGDQEQFLTIFHCQFLKVDLYYSSICCVGRILQK